VPEDLSPYETKLLERLKVEWDPDSLMPIGMQHLKVEKLSERARVLLTELATGYQMKIDFGLLGDQHFIFVTRPRR